MNNYYGYPNFSYPNNQNYQQPHHEVYNQTYGQFRQQINLYTSDPGVITDDLKDGFTRYTWLNAKSINHNELLDFRLNATSDKQVISGGFNINPNVDVHAVSLAPNPKYPYVMVVKLFNASATDHILLDFWIVVKQK
ncbi:hypothetical protein ACTFSK_30985 [Bacillus cereus group sp. MYBK132-2]|uniref:hypothetical protein n=1 Tax=Bacillus cereus group TaxID=86661 RepID=UPI000BFA3966|nr:hypothetical protein [Bacillus cereus]MDA2491775.1 hypothetical protein [Bacillus cereus]PEW07782.1 hypothetical protein CN440_25015 [Bacillus cereus]